MMGKFIGCFASATKLFSSLTDCKRSSVTRKKSLFFGILIAICVINQSGNYYANALVFKNGIPEYLEAQQGRSLIGAGGVILDIPKIRVLRYKVRSSDPHVVSDELDCENGECGDIVEPPLNKLHLGTNSAKEANEWAIPANVTQLVIECKSRSGVVEWEYEGNGVTCDWVFMIDVAMN